MSHAGAEVQPEGLGEKGKLGRPMVEAECHREHREGGFNDILLLPLHGDVFTAQDLGPGFGIELDQRGGRQEEGVADSLQGIVPGATA